MNFKAMIRQNLGAKKKQSHQYKCNCLILSSERGDLNTRPHDYENWGNLHKHWFTGGFKLHLATYSAFSDTEI